MGLIVLAIFAIILGAVIRTVGPTTGKPGARGASRLAGYGFMFVGLLLAISNGFTVIGVGEVGVKHLLGSEVVEVFAHAPDRRKPETEVAL